MARPLTQGTDCPDGPYNKLCGSPCYDSHFHRDDGDMQTVFQHRGYSIDCAPRELDDGTFGAQVVLTKIGYNPEKKFDALPVFTTDSDAIAHAKKFAESWLEGKA